MISFQRVTKKYPTGFTGVSDLSFEVEEGEILVLLGMSGCGKTTALRLINRLIEPTSGEIFFNGQSITKFDPIALRRGIGYAIQHIGLFTHMTVAENISIVPRLLKWPEKKIEKRIDELLGMVGLDPKQFSHLYPVKLSGGQKQRVGVARALAADPPVILMDEPFGALDPLMRDQLQNEFLEIQSKIRKTVVFVTHDLSEAVKMGNRIAVLNEGKLVQIAKPAELIEKPANTFIDRFLGKDRIQLLLQTKSLGALMGELPHSKNEGNPTLEMQSSLMEALMAFKHSGSSTLSIYNQKEYLGELVKESFLQNLSEIL
ncbi:MAG: Osmoprotectant import ATP-binding protein OsmV [Chlamydiae bacterium]|nr:Osmoprotectant import ATP-binding protein OsmV [Chlamydiota bacterium]